MSSSLVGPQRLYRLLVDLVRDHVRWRVRVTQAALMAKLGCTLRTLQRWTAKLRDLGWITTRQSIDGRGYRSTNVYDLLASAEDDHGGPVEVNTDTGSPSTDLALAAFEASLRSVAAPPVCPISAIRTREPAVGDSVQMSLFDMPKVDAQKTVVNTDKAANVKQLTPTNKVVAYWLDGRVERPSRGAVTAVAKAVKKCLEAGITESELRGALDDLMRRDLDWSPTQVYAYFNLAHSKQKPRDYKENPLYKQHPRTSAMTPERARSLAQPPTGSTQEAIRSFVRRMSERLPSSTGSLPAGAATQPVEVSDYHRAAREELYVQECRERGRNPVEHKKGVFTSLVAQLRAQVAAAR